MSALLATSPSRFAAIDMLRGVAMVWMTLFHFSFDLQHFGYLQANFYGDPFWTVQRAAIVSLFVFCAGLGQAIAAHQHQSWSRFWRRWWQIALCALAVSAASWVMFPQAYIYFGILHGMAVMLILARLLAARNPGRLWPLLLLGAIALALPSLSPPLHAQWPALDFLNTRWWNWLGLISHKPMTEDYAPLFPWLGVMCFGLACGQWLLRQPARQLERSMRPRKGLVSALQRALALLGRWSLTYYMLHQPILIGLFTALTWLRQD
jgi:uncharacterized membrane protein